MELSADVSYLELKKQVRRALDTLDAPFLSSFIFVCTYDVLRVGFPRTPYILVSRIDEIRLANYTCPTTAATLHTTNTHRCHVLSLRGLHHYARPSSCENT